MLASHNLAKAIGAVGVVAVLGHVALGPSVVPVAVALAGAFLAAAAGLYFAIARRRGAGRPEG
jgi:hypothetical protein